MNHDELSRELSSCLGLESPPVAMALADEAPAGIDASAADVPSACTFWRQAEDRVFYAAAEDHMNCPVGAMVMGFALPDAVMAQLQELVGNMCECSYIAEAEVSEIPSMGGGRKGAVYGPLAEFPLAPDLILLWLTPRQAMYFGEAAGTCSWTESLPTTALGRPACGALPTARDDDRATVSLGCLGMRTFTEVSDDRLLAVVPGSKGQELAEGLRTIGAANAAMGDFYQAHKANFA